MLLWDSMKHRHLDIDAAQYSVATISSILERGDARDVIELLRTLRRDPSGPVAKLAKIACRNSDVYGYPALFRACLEEWSGEQRK